MEYRILSGVPISDESNLEDIAIVGSFKGHWMGEFELTTKTFKQIIANAKKSTTRIVVDYDHQSFWGGSSKAAGWIDPKKGLSISEDGTRLMAKVEWTESARTAIKAEEYMYKSPVIALKHVNRESGDTVESAILHSLALTNTPFLTELSEVRINSLNQKFQGGRDMEDLKKIAAVLGVEASVDAIVNRCQGLLTQVKELEPKAKLGEVALSELGCSADALVATVMELKNPARGQDQVVALQARIAELESLNRSREASDAVARALNAGKLTAVGTELHAWALSFAQKDLKGFETWVNAAPKMVPTEPVQPILKDLPQVTLSKSLGLTEEDLKSFGDKI